MLSMGGSPQPDVSPCTALPTDDRVDRANFSSTLSSVRRIGHGRRGRKLMTVAAWSLSVSPKMGLASSIFPRFRFVISLPLVASCRRGACRKSFALIPARVASSVVGRSKCLQYQCSTYMYTLCSIRSVAMFCFILSMKLCLLTGLQSSY